MPYLGKGLRRPGARKQQSPRRMRRPGTGRRMSSYTPFGGLGRLRPRRSPQRWPRRGVRNAPFGGRFLRRPMRSRY